MKTSLTPVVSDADVLIHLAKLGRLPLLRVLYERVSIPEYVRQEITSESFILLSPSNLNLNHSHLKHRSFLFDLKILFMTFVKVVRREGVTH